MSDDKVKRYSLHIGMHDEDPDGNMVKHEDYTALEAENARLDNLIGKYIVALARLNVRFIPKTEG